MRGQLLGRIDAPPLELVDAARQGHLDEVSAIDQQHLEEAGVFVVLRIGEDDLQLQARQPRSRAGSGAAGSSWRGGGSW